MPQHEDQDLKTRSAALAVRRREFLALMTGALAAPALGTGALAQGTPRKGGVLRVSAWVNPSSLDPTTGGAGSDHIFLYTMFDTLVEWDYETLKPKPGLAQAFKFTDPQTLVLDLREGVTFHDGTPFNAEAVKFNLDRNRQDQRSNVKAELTAVEEVVVTGPLQVTLKLKEPDSALPLVLSDRSGMMSSPKAVQELGKEHDRKPVGTGAWKIVSWDDNQKIVTTRNEKYWKPNRPFVDGIEFAIIPEIATGLRSVVAGQNDYVYNLSPQMKPIVERAKNLKFVSGPTLYVIQMFFNYARAPLNDVRVRQALNHAVDRDAFVKLTLTGVGEAATMNLPKAHWAYEPSVASLYPYDPDKARKLLAEAGFKDGLDLACTGYTDQISIRRQEVLIENFAKVGIRAKFANAAVAETAAQFFGKEKKGDALLAAWTGRPDPSMTYALMFAKDAYYNAGRSEASAELSEAMRETRSTADPEARKIAFAKVQRLVMENALVLPIVFQLELDAHSEKVKGYRPNLLGKPKFEDVWLEA